MAYIPPHKRHLKGGGSSSSSSASPSPAPIPESLAPQFKRGLNLKSFPDKKTRNQGKGVPNFVRARNAIFKWFPVGLASDDDDDGSGDDRNLFVQLTRLEPVSLESSEPKYDEKRSILLLKRDCIKEWSEGGRKVFMENPWTFIAENVKQDLISAFESALNGREDNKFEAVKSTLVAQFGKILFHRRLSTVESIENKSLPESTVRRLHRIFNTYVSPSYMEYINSEAIPKIGLDFEEEKSIFQVKVADNMQPDSTISCKCTLAKDSNKLELFKIELNQVLHLVVHVSCLDKKLDLRLMLSTKRIVTALSEDEIKCIKNLISSAILDPEVKGGLRWPLGKDSSGDRFTVVGVWHTKGKSFRNSSIRLKTRHVNRFDFISSSGEVEREVTVKMPGIVSELQVQRANDDLLCEMLKSNLKMIWDSCLSYGH